MTQPRLSSDVLLFGGVISLIAAALAGELAWLHMRALGDICGASQVHCVWCPTAAALAAVGGALLISAALLGRRRSPVTRGAAAVARAPVQMRR